MQSIARYHDIFDSGREKEKIEIAENLLAMGMSVEDVSKGTGLTIEEVKDLTVVKN